jgi:hypothetical protein
VNDPRLPVTPRILSVLGNALLQTPDGYEQLLIWAANPACHLTPRDVSVNNAQNLTILCIRLKASKTDTTCQGVNLGRTCSKTAASS